MLAYSTFNNMTKANSQPLLLINDHLPGAAQIFEPFVRSEIKFFYNCETFVSLKFFTNAVTSFSKKKNNNI